MTVAAPPPAADTPPSGPSDEPAPVPRRRRRPWRGLSMGTWLAIALLVVTILSLLLSSLVTLGQATNGADGLVKQRTAALLSLQADAIERYLTARERNAVALADSGTVADALRRFSSAYADLDDEIGPDDVSEATTALTTYYRDEVVPGIEAASGRDVSVAQLLPTRDAGRYLQRRYTLPDATDVPVAERIDAGDGSTWSVVHAQVHPDLSRMADRAGFEDLMLVTADPTIVVYTVAKQPELGTSLEVGPYSGGAVAATVRAVRDATERDVGAQLTDIAPYVADAGRPAMFVVAPVVDGDEELGLLVGRLPLQQIDRIMTADRDWEDAGFGATGETFLVGADGRMRSVSRAFVEDPVEYLRTVARARTATADERRTMRATDTTVPVQRVLSDDEVASLPNSPAPTTATSYLGRDVLTAAEQIDVAELDWSVVAQAGISQVEAELVGYRRNTVVAVAVVILIIALGAVAWGRRTFRPVQAVSERLQRIHDGRPGAPADVGARAPREFAQLSASVEDMVTALGRRRDEVDAAIAERRATLQTLLPPTVAARLADGDRRVVDQIPQASVAVLSVAGLPGIVQHGDVESGRETLDRVVSALDPLAERHGLVRVKLLGDSYFAGCGLERPFLDHAVRAVRFARDAQREVRRLTVDTVGDVRLSIGIDSGPVTVGLAGSVLLVFEMWGDTVNAAHLLAQRAQPGATLLSDRTHGLLPDEIGVRRLDGPAGAAWRLDEEVAAGTEEPES